MTSIFDDLPESIKRRYLRTYQNVSGHWFEVQASTGAGGVLWADSEGDFRIPVHRPYTHEDVTPSKPKHPDFVWCEWCGSKNHYTDLKCSSCGGTL